MIDLIEEFEENTIIYVVVFSTKDFYFAEYEVAESKYEGIKKHFAKLILKDSQIRKRYFNDVIVVKGFRLEGNETLKRPYKFYNDKQDMVKDFYRFLNKQSEENQRLIKKIKNRFTEYF